MLTTAGAAATGIAGLASAELVDFTHELDRWAGEHAWQVFSSGGATVASMYISSSSLFYAGASSLSMVTYSATSSHFATVTGVLDLASGTYNVQMQDSYGDGWSWGSFVGGLAIGSGSASISGASASFSFTVAGVPAPGALALLGLAGVAGSRRRK